ncbi:MAG: 1-acyl-sn-glycerol-3-phosphate acyltransferase [Firmicutes bacterium]|nr:1-acyl-sn-glycerol-3-phosphate acyltransferase [Bacillota bacterium]
MDTPTTIEKAPDRIAVLERIAEYEKQGLFDKDVEVDPPWTPVDPMSVDFCYRKPRTKIKAKIANFFGRRFFGKMIKTRQVIFAGVTGLENLDGFKGGAIITCNHINQFDSYPVQLGFEKKYGKKFRMFKIIREGNYSYPGKIGFFLRSCNTLPINEGENFKLTTECMKGVRHHLSKGRKILIYPEQGMWWNYKKPRPLKKGAFMFASKFNAPVIPCFLTLKDSDLIGADGFPVQEFTINILPLIYPEEGVSAYKNAGIMKDKNYQAWKDFYEKHYGVELKY